MSDSKYNGWTNYATWRVNLEIFDGVAWLESFDSNTTVYDAADYLKQYAIDLIECGTSGLVLDYALAFLDEVDWREIAQSMYDAYESELV